MSQFRKVAASIYVSQWGGDNLNAGTDPIFPKKNTANYEPASNSNLLFGSGVYNYSQQNTSGASSFEGDGIVVLNCIMLPSPTSLLVSKTVYVKDLTVKGRPQFGVLSSDNCAVLCDLQTDIYMRTAGTVNTTQIKINTLFKGKIRFIGGFSFGMENCIIDFDTDSLESIQTCNAPTPAQNPNGFGFNFFSKQTPVCLIRPSGNLYANLTNHINNLINCPIVLPLVDLVKRESKLLIDGSPRPDANPALPDIADVWAEFYTLGNFACVESDLKFIDIITRTVEPDSILLQKVSSRGFYIGGVKVGKKIDLDESGFTITKTGIDDSNPNFWKIAGGSTFAKIRITGKVSDSLISGQTLDIRIPFNFDGDAVGGTANNNNVPDAWNARTTPDTKGIKPNRLTFEVRSSRLTNPGRDVSADWDNDNTNNPSIAGQYYLMEYGQPMQFHILASIAYGNADANAINAAVKQPFNYRSLDIIITITDTRVI